jgi:hypothetical protein
MAASTLRETQTMRTTVTVILTVASVRVLSANRPNFMQPWRTPLCTCVMAEKRKASPRIAIGVPDGTCKKLASRELPIATAVARPSPPNPRRRP